MFLVRVYVCVCVCVREREKEIEQERDCTRKQESQITLFTALFQGFALLVCVSKREGEREKLARERKWARERLHAQKKELNYCACCACQRGRNVASDESGFVCFEHTKQTCCGNVTNSSSA